MNIPQSTRTAVIRHVSGQDGAYPAQPVLSRGYRVVETAREAFDAVVRGMADAAAKIVAAPTHLQP